MVELVDTGDLKSPDFTVVPVQVRPRAPLQVFDFKELFRNTLNTLTQSPTTLFQNSRRIVDKIKTLIPFSTAIVTTTTQPHTSPQTKKSNRDQLVTELLLRYQTLDQDQQRQLTNYTLTIIQINEEIGRSPTHDELNTIYLNRFENPELMRKYFEGQRRNIIH